MSYNGSGTFLINSAGQPVVPGTTITTTAFNALTADLASGLTTAMTKDGQTVPTANILMGGFKLTGLGAGTSATDAAQFGQLQNAPVATLITVSGADTITGTLVQTLTAYATGQQFSFVAAGTNTTAVTLNIDGLGAKAVTRTGAVALAAGALVSGQMAIVEYDGTRFQLINANAFTNLTVSGALTVGTTLAVTGVATLTAQPVLSSLTASQAVFSDGSKGLVSNAITGTGNVMMSASPTTTGTLTAAAINASGLVAMAGAATVGTTLGVTGTSTMAAINASGALTGITGVFTGAGATPALSNGNLVVSSGTTTGAIIAGKGSGTDLYLANSSYQAVLIVAAGTTNVTIPNGTFAVTNNATVGGTLGVTGITSLADQLKISGNNSVSTGVANGNGNIGTSTVNGLMLIGQGSTTDFALLNKNGGVALSCATGSLALSVPGTLGVTGVLSATGQLAVGPAQQIRGFSHSTLAGNTSTTITHSTGALLVIRDNSSGNVGLFLVDEIATSAKISDPGAVFNLGDSGASTNKICVVMAVGSTTIYNRFATTKDVQILQLGAT